MNVATLIKSYPWYLPAHIALWRSCGGEGVEQITELIVSNHPEAVIEREEIDIESLLELVDEPTTEVESVAQKARPVVMDAITSLKMMEPKEVKRNSSRDLIDKFLEVKDLRIVASNEEVETPDDVVWSEADCEQPYTIEDELASEELARIYLNQRLYSEASDIYNRLFLLYSEKSVYFATQIENIDKILRNNEENN